LRADDNDDMAALLKEFWPALQRLGRVTVFVDDGHVLHFIGGSSAPCCAVAHRGLWIS
jgi:hypothetical protein